AWRSRRELNVFSSILHLLPQAGLRHRAEQLAAIGDELRSGGEAGLVGGDEQHQARDLIRLGDARNRQVPYSARSDSCGVRPGCHRRACIAGVDGVDADVVVPQLERGCLGQPTHPHLLAVYAPSPNVPVNAAPEEILTIAPPPALRIEGTTARIPRYAPVKFTSITI